MHNRDYRGWRLVGLVAAVVLFFAQTGHVQGAAEGGPAEKAVGKAQGSIDRALGYLKNQQKADGSWQRSDREPPAISAIVLRAFAADAKTGAKAAFVRKGYEKLLSLQKEDGGICRDMLANYNTAVAISALAAADDAAYKERIEKAIGYLKAVQWNDTIAGPGGKSVDVNHPWYGGWGYARGGRDGGRPDLSNTNVVLEALHDAGLKADDPAMQHALKFVSRMQNNSETNPLAWSGNDGGFVYSMGADGRAESAAGEYQGADGRRLVRSYGSMTYGALKSMIYAGLEKQDPRVKAAWGWISKNWTLQENPGMRANNPASARAGIYYYFQTFAKSLAAAGEPMIKDANGNQHDWRIELIDQLSALQKQDGSFVGEKNWMEDNPVLATAMATLAMQEAVRDLKMHPVKE